VVKRVVKHVIKRVVKHVVKRVVKHVVKRVVKHVVKRVVKNRGKVDQQLQVVATVTKMFPLDPWLPFQKILSPFLGSVATPSKWVQGATWRW